MMATFSPSRRLLGLPAWVWVLLPLPLIGLGDALWKLWPAPALDEPPERAAVFRDVLLLAHDGEQYRFVPLDDRKGVTPLWAVSVIVRTKSSVQWQSEYFLPGLFRMESTWGYELTTARFDEEWMSGDRKDISLPAEQVRALRPQIIAELNRRDPAAQRGAELESMLNDGLHEESSLCPQNAIIIAGWLSLPMALVALCAMFIPRRAA